MGDNMIKLKKFPRYLMERYGLDREIVKDAIVEITIVFDDKNNYGFMRTKTTDDSILKECQEHFQLMTD